MQVDYYQVLKKYKRQVLLLAKIRENQFQCHEETLKRAERQANQKATTIRKSFLLHQYSNEYNHQIDKHMLKKNHC